jgi:hypothetical protein
MPAESFLLNHLFLNPSKINMGIGRYLKSRGPPAPPTSQPPVQGSGTHTTTDQQSVQRPIIGSFTYGTELASSRSSIAHSGRSAQSSYLDNIKHEVMVNYLYQQQCSRLWVSDGSGEMEGVLLRKARSHYLACPPALATSVFAMLCAELNVQVAGRRVLTSGEADILRSL